MTNKKVKFSIISIFGFLVIGLTTFSTIYYTYNPFPTDNEIKENLVDLVFNNYFNDKKEIVIHNETKDWWDVIGSESNFMKDFYNELNTKAYYKFSDVKIRYNNEPKLDNSKVYIDLKLNINKLTKEWIYKGFINYKIEKKPN